MHGGLLCIAFCLSVCDFTKIQAGQKVTRPKFTRPKFNTHLQFWEYASYLAASHYISASCEDLINLQVGSLQCQVAFLAILRVLRLDLGGLGSEFRPFWRSRAWIWGVRSLDLGHFRGPWPGFEGPWAWFFWLIFAHLGGSRPGFKLFWWSWAWILPIWGFLGLDFGHSGLCYKLSQWPFGHLASLKLEQLFYIQKGDSGKAWFKE